MTITAAQLNGILKENGLQTNLKKAEYSIMLTGIVTKNMGEKKAGGAQKTCTFFRVFG